MATAEVAALNYRLVVPTSTRLPAEVLEQAIRAAARDGVGVRVAVPFVLPPTLPIWAAPPRLVARVDQQRLVAERMLGNLHIDGRVEVAACRSEQSLIVQLCDERIPVEIVLAGSAPRALKRGIYGLAPITVVPSRSRFYRLRHPGHQPALES